MRGAGRFLIAFALVLGDASVSMAQTSPEAARTEARERFDRGLRLFNDGDNAGALAEFRRAYELVPNPVVLFNVGLTYAAMNRPVEAVDAFDKLLANPGALAADRLAKAKASREEQAARIAELDVTVNVEGAVIEIDNVEAGRTPLKAPLRVASGSHVVGAVAGGYTPARKEVTIAGRTKEKVAFELVAMQGRLAHLALKTKLPGADVMVDGQSVGKTPLAASLSLAPGVHTVELRRSGYVTAKQDVTLGDGANGEIALDPEEDAALLASEGGMLALEVSEPQSVLSVDGKVRGPYAGPVRLPKGPHRIHLERGGFFPFERDVDIPSGRALTIKVDLEPTPETRASYVSSARSRRTWGLITLGGGVAVTGASVGFHFWNKGKENDAKKKFNAYAASFDPGKECDQAGVVQLPGDTCNVRLDLAEDDLKKIRGRYVIGYVGMGVGVAAIALGTVLIVTGDDPGKYDKKPSADGLGKTWFLAPAPLPNGGGITALGVF
jgi:hypothetical protein